MEKRDIRSRHEEPEARVERVRGGDRRVEHLSDALLDSRVRVREQRDSPPPIQPVPSDDRDMTGPQPHDEGKKKGKAQKKALKKCRKEDEISGKTLPVPSLNPESSNSDQAALHSPRKGPKKKNLDRKRKRSRGESDVSEEEMHSKRKRGPRTPPSMRPEHKSTSPLPKMDNFSDWSDEEVTDRLESMTERTAADSGRRGGGVRGGRERDRGCNPPTIAPLLSQEASMLMPSLTPQPLMSQPLLRKPPPEPQPGRSSSMGSMGSNQSRASARRPRSPSNESAHREEPPGPRARRGRLQANTSRDRERPAMSESSGAERKSRIDQLRRGEPSRSTSSGKNSPEHTLSSSSHESDPQNGIFPVQIQINSAQVKLEHTNVFA